MPELPEVETTRRGIAPHLEQQAIRELIVRDRRLRWPIPEGLEQQLRGQVIRSVRRRAKYLLLEIETGSLIVHLGMSGSLQLVAEAQPVPKHAHVDLVLESGWRLRYIDPRRFGAWLWAEQPLQHPLLASLGPEPLEAGFSAARLFELSRKRRVAIKPFLMDNAVVVGVGNIYATEALFAAGIDPRRAAGTLKLPECEGLVERVRQILQRAIACGGTTLRDFIGGDGKPGYFSQELSVYGRGGQPCLHCGRPLQEVRLGQRASVFCPACQS